MTDAYRSSASGEPDRPTFPELREELGEDPARWLAEETSVDPVPRIRGIDDESVASAWLAVARRLGCSPRIQDALELKRDDLRAGGGDGSDE